jgi:hypothetical protein
MTTLRRASPTWIALFLAIFRTAMAQDCEQLSASVPATRGRYLPTVSRVGLEPSAMLGSFQETPYMTVGGNGEAGFTPLSQYGGGTLSLYGPFSALRATAAPVVTYSRGYDGIVRPEVGTSFSYPFLPAASPVVYPTRSQVRGAFGYQRTPPWWDTGFGWVDMN